MEIKVKKIECNENIIITDYNDKEYIGKIKKGAINFDIFDENENEKRISDILNKNVLLSLKNNIINKIVILTNWKVLTESENSDMEENLDCFL